MRKPPKPPHEEDEVHEFTVKEYAAREKVTVRTVRNWIDKGAIPIRRTAGRRVIIVDGPRVVFFRNREEDPDDRRR